MIRCILFALSLVVPLLGPECAAAAEPRAKVLFIGKQPDHPFGTHMYLHTANMLARCLALNDVQASVSDGWPADAAQTEDVDAVVVYASPAAELLLDGPHRNQFAALVRRGVGLVTIHWASTVRKENLERLGPEWLAILGGTWVSNVGLYVGKSPLEQLQPQHPICRGWQPYEIFDEYYLNPTITDQATPLLQVTVKEKPVIVGWAFERPDGGRSFATTLGHFYQAFQTTPFRRMVVNGILWAAKVPIPDEGAAVELSEQDLALPPRPDKKP